jgi:hypothetical protein
VAAAPGGSATLAQTVPFGAEVYRGKRLRLSADVKAEAVADWAGLWLRVDGPSGTLGLDNMLGRPIRGTSDWTSYAIVLDVPRDSVGIAFGILLAGAGQVWLDDVRFEVVGPDVPTTGRSP